MFAKGLFDFICGLERGLKLCIVLIALAILVSIAWQLAQYTGYVLAFLLMGLPIITAAYVTFHPAYWRPPKEK